MYIHRKSFPIAFDCLSFPGEPPAQVSSLWSEILLTRQGIIDDGGAFRYPNKGQMFTGCLRTLKDRKRRTYAL